MSASAVPVGDVSPAYYQHLAEVRYRIRQFLRFSEESARSHGVEPQQHQLMLVIKGLPSGIRPTIRAISSRLCLRHNSTVELINRLAERGALVRRPCELDRREVLIELTPHGEELLRRLSVLHWEELQTSGPDLSAALEIIVRNAPEQHSLPELKQKAATQ
ncbi:MAG: MarR family transcriptional regulator [Acidobacteriota bacterium]|nr:MarR family transcriptional regulator [Acidobacteriota bacterium]